MGRLCWRTRLSRATSGCAARRSAPEGGDRTDELQALWVKHGNVAQFRAGSGGVEQRLGTGIACGIRYLPGWRVLTAGPDVLPDDACICVATRVDDTIGGEAHWNQHAGNVVGQVALDGDACAFGAERGVGGELAGVVKSPLWRACRGRRGFDQIMREKAPNRNLDCDLGCHACAIRIWARCVAGCPANTTAGRGAQICWWRSCMGGLGQCGFLAGGLPRLIPAVSRVAWPARRSPWSV